MKFRCTSEIIAEINDVITRCIYVYIYINQNTVEYLLIGQ